MKGYGAILIIAITVLFCFSSFAQEKTVNPQIILQQRDQIQRRDQLQKNTPTQMCIPLEFITTSPLPATGVGWDYKYQVQAKGHPPITFKANFDTPGPGPEPYGIGLTMSPNGLIQGQPMKAGYKMVEIIAKDSCPSGARTIKKLFALEIKGPQALTPIQLPKVQ